MPSFLDSERHKNCSAFITPFITKGPEVIDPLWRDEVGKVSVFPFHKPSLYTQRVYSNKIGIDEDSL